MKKINLVSAVLVLALLLCACGAAAPVVTSAPASTDAAGIQPDITPAVETTAAPVETIEPVETVTVTLFIPNDNADGFDERDSSIPGLDAQSLLAALCAEGVLPEDVEVLSFSQSGGALALDLSEGFSQALMGQGTAGETMLIGSVVNTFLSAFGAQQISITVNGAAFETGHSIYDFPFGPISG